MKSGKTPISPSTFFADHLAGDAEYMQNIKPLSSLKAILNDFATEPGFLPYQDCGVARITAGSVFQLIYVQENRFVPTFTIEIVSRPLFYPNKELVLTPGNRLNKFATNGRLDKWWLYEVPAQARESFIEIRRLLQLYAFPFFEATSSGPLIGKSSRRNIFGRSKFGKRINWGSPAWDLFETGHLHLWNGDMQKARNSLNDAHELFSADNRKWATEAAKECLRLLALIEKGTVYISSYLDLTVRQSRENLGLKY